MTARLSERHIQVQVQQLAGFYGWKSYHAPDNRPGRNGRVQAVVAGWPDLFLVRGRDAIAAELKSARGRLGPGQADWLAALEGAGVETYVWRPADLDIIHRRLARGRRFVVQCEVAA